MDSPAPVASKIHEIGPDASFPRSPWECRLGRSAASSRSAGLVSKSTRRGAGGLNLQPGWAGLISSLPPSGPRPEIWISSFTVFSIGAGPSYSYSAAETGVGAAAKIALPSPANKAQAVIHDLIRIVSHSFE